MKFLSWTCQQIFAFQYHKKSIEKVRESVNKMQPKAIIAIALDTKGPEIRTGMLEGGSNKDIPLKKGETIRVTTNDEFKDKCSDKVLYLDYKNLAKVLQPEKLIYIGDGLICLRVDKIDDDSNLTCTIMNEAGLGSKKSCNLPGTDIDLPAVSKKDEEDLKFGVAEGVDMIFASFIRNAAGVSEIRKCLGEEGKHILIISKIENMQGIKNIDEIIEASDGVMVARGDMGQEIPLYEVVVAQKMIIAKCNQAGKPVICATQMLESMVKCPRPTRAEASDVPNAVLDGADCVMLSGETAKGDYPVECVSTMNNLCRSAENIFNYDQHAQEIKNMGKSSQQAFLAMAAAQTATICGASAVVVVSEDGR
uniref:Pyruvate kinase n=1 Tax=Romanomermis culicivorax TaxID=13658 RepID=A0A915K0D3_ROMCU